MIITAKVALAQANKTFKKPKNVRNSLIRQLRKVEKAINRESKKGRTSLPYPCLYNAVSDVLKRNGYKIQNCSNYDYEWIVIYWDETT